MRHDVLDELADRGGLHAHGGVHDHVVQREGHAELLAGDVDGIQHRLVRRDAGVEAELVERGLQLVELLERLGD